MLNFFKEMNLLFWRSCIPGLKRISFHCRKCSSAKKYARITCQILSYKFFRFVLYQLSKNLNRPFFMDFLTQLSIRYTEKSAVVDEEDPDDQGEEIKCVCFWTMWWVHSLYLTVWSGLQSVHTHICTDSQFQNNFKCGHTSLSANLFSGDLNIGPISKMFVRFECNLLCANNGQNEFNWCNTLLLASYWINLIFSCLAFHLSIMHTYFYISWYQPR